MDIEFARKTTLYWQENAHPNTEVEVLRPMVVDQVLHLAQHNEIEPELVKEMIYLWETDPRPKNENNNYIFITEEQQRKVARGLINMFGTAREAVAAAFSMTDKQMFK